MKPFKIIVVLIILSILLTGCVNVTIDNTTKKSELITKTYKRADLEELANKASHKMLLLSEFKYMYKPECMRRHKLNAYIVLSLDDGSNAYVFLNVKGDDYNDWRVGHIFIFKDFKNKDEFLNNVKPDMTMKDVLKYDSNFAYGPFSSMDVIAHYVKEGMFYVIYKREERFVDSLDQTVESIVFISNEECYERVDAQAFAFGVIWEMDKIN